jgi:gliding motility-associated-like protein
MVKDDNACTATSGGSITVTAAGGSPAYTYILSRGGTVIRSQASNVFTNLGAGNYAVEVRDSKGCTAAAQNIVLLPELEFTVTETKKIDCTASPAATVQVAVSSGSGNYEYEVLNSAGVNVVTRVAIAGTTVTFSAATADTYTVRVFDVGVTPNCSETKTINIAPSINPSFTHVVTNSVCNGSNSGSIRVTAVANGAEPLTYAITPAAGTFNTATSSFENLPPNTYSITATGANSCTTTVNNIVITEFAAIAVPTPVVNQFGCTTANTTNPATITIPNTGATVITGGSGTYVRVEFIDTKGTPDTADDFVVQDSNNFTYSTTDEAGSTYQINVYDDRGCVGSTTATIAPFAKLLTAPVAVDKAIDCATGENITVTFTSSNPIPAANISYTITGANTGFTATNSTGVFTNLATDIYNIAVTNTGTGCVLTTSHSVSTPPSHTVDINKVSNVACLGTATGAISFGFSAAPAYTGNYNYEVFQSSGTTTGITGNNVNGTTTVSTLPAGTYYVQLTMVASPFCPVRSGNITIEAPASALTLTANPSLISCVRPDSGEVQLTAAGGWGSYQYQLVNTTTSTTVQAYANKNVIDGLVAGRYEATVRDLNGCTTTVSFELTDPTAITATFTVANNACYADAAASITVTNPTGGQGTPAVYRYSLTYPNGTISAIQTGNVFTNLKAGNYEIRVYDDYSCQSAPIPVTITDPTRVVAQATIVAPITCTRSQSSVQVSGTGGTGAYMYSMDGTNFVASNVFNVDAGKHQFYVRDANGCISDPVSLVTVDPYEEIRSRLVVNAGVITCNGENNGVLSATVVGGLGNYRYELLDDANNVVRPLQTTSRFDQLSAGRYKIRVYSSNAGGDICQIDTSVHEITEPDALRIASDVKQVSCNGGKDGRITINSRGGNGGYQYNISPGFAPSKFVSNNVFDNLAPGIYTITVKDQVGCYDTIRVEIGQPTAVTAALVNVTQQVCSADPTPTISITIGGGILPAGGPTTYIISLNGIDLPGTYNAGTVVLGAAEGIEANKKYGIGVRSVSGGCSPVFIPTVIETVKPIALQLQAGLTYTCPTGNVINAGVQDEYKSVVVYSLLDNGSIVASNDTGIFTNVAPSANYTVSVEHVVSSCPVSVTIPEVRDITALAMAVDDSQKNKLIASGNFGLPPYEYSFDDGDFSSDNEMTILETRDYRIRVRDSRGCIVEMIVEGVYITIEVPNLFTPDGDGEDDYWYPTQVEDYHEVRVFIYDRYARQIKIFTGSQQGWDGKYEGRDLPSGDYWYTIYFKELSGQERKIMGHFTLYR